MLMYLMQSGLHCLWVFYVRVRGFCKLLKYTENRLSLLRLNCYELDRVEIVAMCFDAMCTIDLYETETVQFRRAVCT